MVLDAAQLEAITQEARTCFLYEDAPDYLGMFEQGMHRLHAGDGAINLQAEYTALMRAAHSLKGGAGIAQLPTISQLAHKLEDLLQALSDGRVQEPAVAYELISLGVEQINGLIDETTSGKEIAIAPEGATLPILTALGSFLEALPKTKLSPQAQNNFQISSINSYLLKSALEVDLSDCIQRVECLVEKSPVDLAFLQQAFTDFVEECSLLGQTLNLAWLTDTVDLAHKKLVQDVNQGDAAIEQIVTTTLAEIQRLRSQALKEIEIEAGRGRQEEGGKKELHLDLDALTPSLPYSLTPSATQPSVTLNLRIPVSRLDRMNNIMGELLINHERLSLYQTQLQQASLGLKIRTQQFGPVAGQVQTFYDQLATLTTSFISSAPSVDESSSAFDPLEFDRYTEFHSTLQDFQELMVRVQESQADIDLINFELRESLDQLRLQLDSLRADLTDSRLVPFSLIADRFVTPLQTLNQRYNKSVELVVTGKDTLIDQVVLEQLQTPLTHLFRNAFDHGIESSEERLVLDKSPTAQINLSATVQGNQLSITVQDDGRGIDSQKVHQRAVQMGLCHTKIGELTREQILDFLCFPGFSTAAKVTDLSGRGVGLDIVKLQVERLHGLVRIESALGQGTKFTVTIPLTLSILPLLLCRCQQRTLAIPSINILEIQSLSELYNSAVPSGITWHNRPVSLFPLIQLLPYRQQDNLSLSPPLEQQLGIVLDVNGEPIVVTVDSLLVERELVLKPFDSTIPIPAYITGCTVLGSGEVVPVLSPNHFGELIEHQKQSMATSSQTSVLNGSQSKSSYGTPAILIVDDSIAVRRMLDRVLTQTGYQVVQCRDGKEALEELNRPSEHFDCVICDIEMPRLDGFGLLKEIRAHTRWHSLPVAMLTSRENDRHRRKAMSLGVTDYFTKPFHPEKLLRAISEML